MDDATLSTDTDAEVNPKIEKKARELFDGGGKHINDSTFYTHATPGTRNVYRELAAKKLAESEASQND